MVEFSIAMPHFVDLDQSFEQNIRRFTPPAETEIGDILRGLEQDPEYWPQGEEYWFERDENGYCACRHKTHWGDWQLTWYTEDGFGGKRVVVGLDHQPLRVDPIPPRSGNSW